MSGGLFVVYEAGSLAGAEMLRQRLKAVGIESRLRNDFLHGALGELPLSVRPEVCVLAEADILAAREVVLEMEAQLRTPVTGEVTCPGCGEVSPANFEVCWKCRRPFDE